MSDPVIGEHAFIKLGDKIKEVIVTEQYMTITGKFVDLYAVHIEDPDDGYSMARVSSDKIFSEMSEVK